MSAGIPYLRKLVAKVPKRVRTVTLWMGEKRLGPSNFGKKKFIGPKIDLYISMVSSHDCLEKSLSRKPSGTTIDAFHAGSSLV